MRTLQCAVHGTQQVTWVCQHVLRGLVERRRVGFFWTAEDPDNPRPDAYCAACEERAARTNGKWVGEALAELRPKSLCGACYDLAKTFHLGGNPWA